MVEPAEDREFLGQLDAWVSDIPNVLVSRREDIVRIALITVGVAAVLALIAPSFLPPNLLVGAIVGLVAVAVAVAVAVVQDSSDTVVRGPRHVATAGGQVAVRVGSDPADVDPIIGAMKRHRTGDAALRVAMVPASGQAPPPILRVDQIGERFAGAGGRVVIADLSPSWSPAPGLSDVVAGTKALKDVAEVHEEHFLARVSAGPSPDRALEGLPEVISTMPTDVDLVVAALPPLVEPGVLGPLSAFDVTFLVVDVGETLRVDLTACFDALDAFPAAVEVVLAGDGTGG